MELNIQGKVVEILEEQSGEGKNGPWRRRDFILEMDDRFSRKVCVSQWGDSIDNDSVSVGETVKAFINLQSREYNGRWYTDVRAWRIDKDGAGSPDGQYPDEPFQGSRPAGRQQGGAPTHSGSSPQGGASSQGGGNKNNMLDGDLEDVDDDLPF